jgi:hypothetical protein
MGNVFFDTDVNKTVDIFKTVDLTVTKDVFSFVDLTGNLATAEASADAIGGSTPGPGPGPGTETCEQLSFLLDGFGDDQTVTAQSGTTVTGVAPGITIPPDGSAFTDTLIPNGVRTVTVDNFFGPGVAATLINGTPSQGNFSNDQDTNSNQSAFYESGDGDPYSVLVDCPPDGIIDLTDLVDEFGNPTNVLQFNGVDLGAENGTLRSEIEITDADGTVSTLAGYAVSGDYADSSGLNEFVDGQSIYIPLGLFTGDIPLIADDVELAVAVPFPGSGVGFYSAGGVVEDDSAPGANDELDLTQVVSVNFSLLGNPADFGTPQTALESPTTDAWDVSVDLIGIESECCTRTPPPPGGGNLAETDTFAQVTEDGAFSFSESLAAFDPFEIA